MLLAIDTSTAQVGLALCDDGGVGAESIWRSRQHHTVEVAPALVELLRRCGITMAEVAALAVAVGPGSYTALRVGLAIAKGLALPRKLPIVGIPTLDILAAGTPPVKVPLVAVLQAGRRRIAVGRYRSLAPARDRRALWGSAPAARWKPDGGVRVTTVEELASTIDEPTLVTGELTPDERQRLARKKTNVVLAPLSECVRRPSILAEMGWARWRSGQIDDPRQLAPIYLQFN